MKIKNSNKVVITILNHRKQYLQIKRTIKNLDVVSPLYVTYLLSNKYD